MLAAALKRQRCPQQLRIAHAVDRKNVSNTRFTRGYRACFIKSNDTYTPGLLERRRGLEKYTVFSSDTVADHDRDRCCQPERARAAYHKHGNTARKRIADRVTEQEPHNGRHNRYRNDHGHKHAGNLVGYLGYRGLCRRSITDHFYYLRQRCILTDTRCAAFEKSRLIDRCRRHSVAGCLVGRYALARQSGFIDGA